MKKEGITARIIGTGSYLPKTILTNSELYNLPKIKKNFNIEKAKDKYSGNSNEEIFNDWATQVTGIKQRHVYNNDFNNQPDYIGPIENMGAEAAKQALSQANLSPKDLDFIVAATFTQEQTVPNPACSIGHLIGAKNIPGIHINNACAGFVYGLINAYKEITTRAKNVLVVASEQLTKVTDYTDPKTAVLFADGAGAAILTTDKTGILGFSRSSKYEDKHISLKNEPSKENFVKMGGGPQVLANAVRAMSKETKNALKNANLTLEDIKYIIPHQANKRITKNLAKNLKIPLEKMVSTIETIGNTSGSSVAIALDKLIRGELPNYNIEKGDKIVLTAVGVGYTMGAVVMEIGEIKNYQPKISDKVTLTETESILTPLTPPPNSIITEI